MREHVEKLANGFFERDTGKMTLSEKKLELMIDLNKVTSGSFTIAAPDDRKMQGSIFSSSPRMRCKVGDFDDYAVEVPYEFDSTGMEEGDVLKGEIVIISQLGEYYLPFVASVVHSVLRSSIGTIKNLFHFTNLAQSDYDEAVKLFYSSEFRKIFVNNDRMYLSTYLGLSAMVGNKQNVEEFLISIHKKEPVYILTPEETVEFADIQEEISNSIPITKVGWGYINVEVSSDASFLIPERRSITEDDFLGNHFDLEVRVDSSQLHNGNNFGRVILITPYYSREVHFCIHMGTRRDYAQSLHAQMQKLNLELTNVYLSFRIKNINTANWIKESTTIVEHMIALDDTCVEARLFQAQLLLSAERFQEAKWILDHVATDLKIRGQSSVQYGYYLYLLSLLQRDNEITDDLARQVHELYNRNRTQYRLLWVLLYLDAQIGKNQSMKLSLLEHQFETGCTSPVLYVEAYHIYVANPTLMVKLEDFELHVLLWSVRMGLVPENLVRQVVYLSSRMKRFSPFLHRILCAYYEEKVEDEILTAICTHLIKGNMTDKVYFPWYAKAVEREMRITRLYEYYMYSIPMNWREPLPRMVQMYFAYNSDLDYKRNALLYRLLIDHQESSPEILRSYESQICAFTMEQIGLENIDENLSRVYDYMMKESIVREEMKKHFSSILFVNRIRCENRKIRCLVMITPQMCSEDKAPFIDGNAYLSVYSQEYEMFLEDADGNRYHQSISYEVEPLMKPMRFLTDIKDGQTAYVGLSIFVCEENKHYISIHEDKVSFIRHIVDSNLIRESYKRELRLKLMYYYYDHDRIQELDDFLTGIDAKILIPKDRAELIEFMIRRDMQEEAYEIVRVYGTENIGSKILVKLCSKMIRLSDYEEDTYLVQISHMVFRAGKYDQTVLKYLTMHFEGTIKEMRNIWKAAVNFEIDTHAMEEKMIVQMLYTRAFLGEKDDIFESYQRGGAVSSVELAYLTYNAFEYFIEDSLMDERVFEKILRAYRRGEDLNDVCKLSLIRFFGEELVNRRTMVPYDEETQRIIHQFIHEMLRRNIMFDFFKVYEDEIPELVLYHDKTIVEYKTQPNSRVVLHYVLESEEDEDVQYVKEEMKNMYGGTFSKEFILFFGETLQYYITEEIKDKEMLTQSLVIHNNDISMNGNDTKYAVLNDMMISRALQDDESLLGLMEVYLKKDFVTNQIFHLK